MKKILIVDDLEEIRELLETTFKLAGFRKLFLAKNGQKAIDVARKEKPDLILMDVMMPGEIDGIEATRILKKDPETRIIIVGDASMAPYELMAEGGSIYFGEKKRKPSIENLQFLSQTFRHCVWLNPHSRHTWANTWTTDIIQKVFPMFELTLDGLQQAVKKLIVKR